MHETVDFLQTDQIWIFGFNHLNDSLEPIQAVSSTDSFVNIPAQKSHGDS
jgi:hypothetical protein